MIPLLLALFGSAAELHLVAVDGPVRVGRPARVQAVVLDDDGAVIPNASPVPGQGTARTEDRADLPGGVVSLLWTPPDTPGSVRWTVEDVDSTATLDVLARAVPPWQPPRRLDVFDAAAIRAPLTGSDVPAPGELQVATSEPATVSFAREGDPELRLSVPGSGARVVLVALHDLRRDATPRVFPVRIIERPTLSFDLEAGATMTVRVAGRSYGPFVSDGTDPVRARIEQYPGEQQAELIVADDLGNELITPYVLAARADPVLTVISAGRTWPGDLAPETFVAAATSDGRPWSGPAPSCRGPDVGEMDLVRVESGLWRVVEPPREVSERDLRVDCRLGETVASHRVPAPLGIPVAVDLQVYPEQVSTDFPVAEVTAHVVDAAGERLAAEALVVVAETGAIMMQASTSVTRRGEYRGGVEAIRDGTDVIEASLRVPTGSGPVAHVQLAHGSVPRSGGVRVHGRALDAAGRPLPGVPIRLAAGQAFAEVSGGDDGWATAVLEPPVSAQAFVLEARAGPQATRAVRARGTLPWGGGPGLPDIVARKTIQLTAGRVSTLRLETDTPVLYATPGARLDVRIYLYDRGENLVTDEIPVLSVDEGALGPPRLMPDGGYRAEYVPTLDTSGGTVTIVARAPTGSASATYRLRLELRPVRAAVGLAAGVISNLGGITSLTLSVDGDLRLPALSDQLVLRLGVAGYTTSRQIDTGAGLNVKRLTVLPITVGALVRQDRGQNAAWLGLGATIAPYSATERFDDSRFPARTGVLPPGFAAVIGGARRIRSGEAFLEIRGTFLSAPGGDVGFTGQVGGLGAVLGYRLVID